MNYIFTVSSSEKFFLASVKRDVFAYFGQTNCPKCQIAKPQGRTKYRQNSSNMLQNVVLKDWSIALQDIQNRRRHRYRKWYNCTHP